MLAVALLSFLVAFLCYRSTVAPTVVARESNSDLIIAASALGIPHPPGYPLYTLLGRLWTMLPISTPAFRTNLMSGAFAAGAVAVLCLILLEITANPLAAICGALSLAFSRSLWSQAVITEVYTFHLFVLLLTLYGLILHLRRGSDTPRALPMAAFLLGVALTAHSGTVLFIPGFLVLLLAARPRPRARSTAILIGLMVLGLSVYLYLPIRSSQNPVLDWQHPANLRSLVEMITLRYYELPGASRTGDDFRRQLMALLALSPWNFGWLLIVLAVVGVVAARTTNPWLAISTVLLFGGTSIGVLVGFNVTPEKYKIGLHQFLIPAFAIVAIWIGLGVDWLAQRASRIRGLSPAWAKVVVAALLAGAVGAEAAQNHRSCNLRDNFVGYDYAQNILSTCDPNSILFLMVDQQDTVLFATMYLHHVEHQRPDVAVISPYMLSFDWYRQHLHLLYPDLDLPTDRQAQDFMQEIAHSLGPAYDLREAGRLYDRRIMRFIIDHHVAGRPIVCAIDPKVFVGDVQPSLKDSYVAVLAGVAWKIVPKREPTRSDVDGCHHNLWDIYSFRGVLSDSVWLDVSERSLIKNYALAHNMLGNAYVRMGALDEAIGEYLRGIRLEPEAVELHYNLADLYARKGMAKEALASWRKALELTTDDDIRRKIRERIGAAERAGPGP